MKIDLDQIRDLLSVFSQTDITELTIESGEEKITLKKGGAPVMHLPTTIEVPGNHQQPAQKVQTAAPEPVKAAEAKAEDKGSTNGYVAITSPMVGTFYSASSPTSPPFLSVGDRVSVGQTVCIIEAMKLMNDLPAEISGKVVKVLVDNGTTVEFGQQLFLVDPAG